MGQVKFARDKLRAKLVEMLDEYEAMLVFLARIDEPLRRSIAEQRLQAESEGKRQLLLRIEKLSSQINSLRRTNGATQRVGYYSKALRDHPGEEARVRTIPIYTAVALFNNYPGLAEALASRELPPHTTIELDYVGTGQRPLIYEFRITEAMFFEDMCFFWNESSELARSTNPITSEKLDVKRLIALHRAVVSSAFYMVEAFCNGLALEVWLTRKDELTDRELQMITEWDAIAARPRYLSIRDKLIHYPRLLMARKHPLIQEGNSPDFDYFLTSAKELRDAIVHANPAPNLNTWEPSVKSQALENLSHQQCGNVLDSAIAVIDQILTATERRQSAFWLQRRQPNGLFDNSVFN